MSSPSSLGMSSTSASKSVADARRVIPDEFAWITCGIQLFVQVGITPHVATVQSAPHYEEWASSWAVDIQWDTAKYLQTVPCKKCSKLPQANQKRTRNRPNKLQMPGGSTWQGDQAVTTPKQTMERASAAAAATKHRKKKSSARAAETGVKDDTAAAATKHGKKKSSSRAAGKGVKDETASAKRNSHDAKRKHVKKKSFAHRTEQPPIAPLKHVEPVHGETIDLTLSSDDDNDDDAVGKEQTQQSSMSHIMNVSSDSESSVASNREKEDSPKKSHYDHTVDVSSNSSISASFDSFIDDSSQREDARPKRYFGNDSDVSSDSSSVSSSDDDDAGDDNDAPVDEVDLNRTESESEESFGMRHEMSDQSMGTDSPRESLLSVRRGERTKERDTRKRACTLRGRRNTDVQRQINKFMQHVFDDRQSDSAPDGGGLIAIRPIQKGTEFIDVSSQYVGGKAPPYLLTERGDTIKSADGYFDIRIGMTQWINEARDGKTPNVRFKKDYNENKIAWQAVRDIQVDEEILAVYDQTLT
eukprot:scaffold145694_cov47-Attheya_sp.AAC.2